MRGNNLSDILASCLDSIERGERSVEECLALYPEQREELRFLLSAAAGVRERAGFSPRPGFHSASRARLLKRLSATSRQSPQHARQKTYPVFSRRLAALWAAVLVLAVSSLGAGTVYASNIALPGDALYPVKLLIEDARLFLASDVEDVSLAAGFAQTRVEEMRDLIKSHREKDLHLAAEMFSNRVAVATGSLAEVAQSDPERAVQLAFQVEQMLVYDTEELNLLLETVPAEAKPAIERAIIVSSKGQNVVQEVIVGGSPGGGPPAGVPGPAATPSGDNPPEESPALTPTAPAQGPPGSVPGPPTGVPGGKP